MLIYIAIVLSVLSVGLALASKAPAELKSNVDGRHAFGEIEWILRILAVVTIVAAVFAWWLVIT